MLHAARRLIRRENITPELWYSAASWWCMHWEGVTRSSRVSLRGHLLTVHSDVAMSQLMKQGQTLVGIKVACTGAGTDSYGACDVSYGLHDTEHPWLNHSETLSILYNLVLA